MNIIIETFFALSCVVTLEQSPGPDGIGEATRFYQREGGIRYALDALPSECTVVEGQNGGREGFDREESE